MAGCTFFLDSGLKAQYAILIEDIGESRINVNAIGNVVGVTGSLCMARGATTYGEYGYRISSPTRSQNVIGDQQTGRRGANGTPGSTGTTASPTSNHAI